MPGDISVQALFVGGITAGIVLSMALDGVGWCWSIIADMARSVLRP